jgi:hypothetical protein
MSHRLGSTPRLTDLLTFRRSVALTLTFELVRQLEARELQQKGAVRHEAATKQRSEGRDVCDSEIC